MDHILVAIDFSEAALHAARYGLFWGAHTGAKVELMHIESAGRSELPTGLPGAEAQLQAVADLLRTIAQADGLTLPPLHIQQRSGAAAAELLRYIEATHPDLVVMGRRGRGGLDKWLLGSVSQRVALHAPVPVLLIPEQAPHRPQLHQLLYASNFEPELRANLLALQALLWPLTFQTHCVHVIEPESEAYFADATADIEAELQEMAETGGPLPRTFYTVLRGEPLAAGLQAYAHARHADLMVLCPKRRNLISRWFQPRTTTQVLQHADLPVLTLPTP